MSWLSDALDFELFNLGEIWDSIKEDPERLFLGALTPAGSELWGGILGKDFESPLNWFGGPSDQTFQRARESGIDTESAQVAHNIAQSIAASYAGGYGLDQLGTFGDVVGQVQSVGNLPSGNLPSGSFGGMPQQQGLLETPEEREARLRREALIRQAILEQQQRQSGQLQGLLFTTAAEQQPMGLLSMRV